MVRRAAGAVTVAPGGGGGQLALSCSVAIARPWLPFGLFILFFFALAAAATRWWESRPCACAIEWVPHVSEVDILIEVVLTLDGLLVLSHSNTARFLDCVPLTRGPGIEGRRTASGAAPRAGASLSGQGFV